MTATRERLLTLGKETLVASFLYVTAFFATFNILMPVQRLFFPEYSSYASLLFLPHGVRVLAGWLMGWRAAPALLPGVFLVYAYVAGAQVFTLNRLLGIAIAVAVAPATFHLLRLLGWDLSPASGRKPCWPCIMVAGVLASVIGAALTTLALGNRPIDFVAYLIGDIAGLFFLTLLLMLSFRVLRARR